MGGTLAGAIQGVAEGDEEEAPKEPRDEVGVEGRFERLVEAGAGVGGEEDRGRMLRAPPLRGVVHDGDIDRGEDGEHGGYGVDLTGRREAANQQVADIDKPEEEFGSEA